MVINLKVKKAKNDHAKMVLRTGFKSNSIVNFHKGNIQVNIVEIIMEEMIVLDETLNDVGVTILKDDGYNTNEVFTDFVARNKEIFLFKKVNVSVNHSRKKLKENRNKEP